MCAHCLAQDPLSHKAAAALESDRNMRAAQEAGPGYGGPPRAMRSATAPACLEGVPLDGVGGAPAAPPAPTPVPTPALAQAPARQALSLAFCGFCGEGRCTYRCCVCGEATHSPNRECSKWGWGGELSGVAVCAECCSKARAPKAKDAVSWERQLQLRARSSRSGPAGTAACAIDASSDTGTDMPGLVIGDSTAAEQDGIGESTALEDRMEGVDAGDRSPDEPEEEELLTDAEERARRRRKTGAGAHVACGMPPPPAASQGVGFFPLLLCYHLDA